jgi:hypothetical protein
VSGAATADLSGAATADSTRDTDLLELVQTVAIILMIPLGIVVGIVVVRLRALERRLDQQAHDLKEVEHVLRR